MPSEEKVVSECEKLRAEREKILNNMWEICDYSQSLSKKTGSNAGMRKLQYLNQVLRKFNLTSIRQKPDESKLEMNDSQSNFENLTYNAQETYFNLTKIQSAVDELKSQVVYRYPKFLFQLSLDL